jgi:para-nitrobenzyl esterase
MLKKILLGFVALIVVIASSAFAYISANKSPQLFEPSVAGVYHTETRVIDADSEVVTNAGKLVGFADSYNTFAWVGIPFAQPPVGELRWKAPQAAKPWETALNATEYGQPCVQFSGPLAGIEGEEGQVVGHEDCLSLNLWAPKTALPSLNPNSKKLPVMFWIHGGGNDSGSARLFQGHHLAGQKDVIVVTINYRLGMLGWLSHESIRATASNLEDASGNYGTLDIIHGLKWVQQNIAQFGGDPDNVTIFGESAGGRNVYSMLASPLAKGLFHRAISQSGTPDTTLLTLAEDFDDNKLIDPVSGLKNSSNGLISLVLSDLDSSLTKDQIRQTIATTKPQELLATLRDVTPEKLMTLAADNGSTGYIQVARVLRDGYVLPKASTLDLFKSVDNYNSVPLMLGANRDENKLFMARNPRYINNLLGVLPRPKNNAYYNRVSEYVSDNWKAGAVDEPAKIITATKAPKVFAYRFDWDESPSNLLVDLPTLIGAAHALEINFVFGDFEGGVAMGPLLDKNNAAGRKELSLAMMDYWAEFAHHGDPRRGFSGQQPEWSAWSQTGANLMVLDTNADGGRRMQEVRNNVADIKAKLAIDDIVTDPRERCEAYAALFLHGYQSSDFWDPAEYSMLGCDSYPAGEFRNS